MPRPDELRPVVAQQLNGLCSVDSPLDAGGPRSTIRLYESSLARVDFRAEVIERFRDQQPKVRRDGYAAIVMAGPPGVGKSTFRGNAYLEGWRVLDPDDIKTLGAACFPY